MRNSRLPGSAARTAVAALAAAAVATLLFASCGGAYSAKKVSRSGDKLAAADALFDGKKFGNAAIEYRDFLQTFAGDERCDYAQFRLAESLRMRKEYALAQVEYKILQNDYGYSEYVDDAFFMEGVCAFKQSPRVERDQTKAYEALDRVTRFLQLFPTSSRVEEGRTVLAQIQEKLAHKDFLSAELYNRGKHYDAALVYYDKIIGIYPETIWAARSHYYRALIRERRGDATGAGADYRDAASAAGQFIEKAEAQKRLKSIEGSAGQPKG